MSTKYLNLDVKALHVPAGENGESELHRVVVGVHIVNAVPRIKGQPRPKQGQVFATAYQFPTAEEAEAMRGLLENVLDFILPVAVQHGVLVPVDAEEAGRTIIMPGGVR
jgi:hypothetical protein